MAALEIAPDEEEKLLNANKDIEWVDDVTEYKCQRCEKVLAQHYIANCKHKFCSNCKRLLGDGSKRWRCPRCNEFITDIEHQDPKFRDEVKRLKLHCPHQKYGCEHVCALKELNEHLKECKHTKDSALPVLYNGPLHPEVLELRAEVHELKRKLIDIENENRNHDFENVRKLIDENAAELKLEMEEMRLQMKEMEAKHRDEKVEMKITLKEYEIRIEAEVVKTSKLNEDVLKLKMKGKDERSLENENNRKIAKLEGQFQAIFQMLESHNKNNNDRVHQLKNEFTDELKEKASVIQRDTDLRISAFKTEMEQISVLKVKQEALENQMQLTQQSFSKTSKQMDQFKKEMNVSMLGVESETDFNKYEISFAKTMNKQMKAQLDELEKYFNILNPHIRYYDLPEKYYKLEADFTWAIHDVPDKITKMLPVTSDLFAFKKYPFIATASLEFYDSGARLQVMAYKSTAEPLQLHLPHRLHLILEDRDIEHDDEGKDQIIACYNMSGIPMKDDTIKYSSSSFPVSFLSKPSATIAIHVEPPEVLQLVHSNDGTLTWAVVNYSERQRMVREDSTDVHWSPYFCTSPNGHKVQIKMSGNGIRLSTELIFLNKECFYGHIASSTYKWKGTVTYFHPLDPTQQVTEILYNNKEMMNLIIMNRAAGNQIPLVEESEINKVLYNDTLHYRVEIRTDENQI